MPVYNQNSADCGTLIPLEILEYKGQITMIDVGITCIKVIPMLKILLYFRSATGKNPNIRTVQRKIIDKLLTLIFKQQLRIYFTKK